MKATLSILLFVFHLCCSQPNAGSSVSPRLIKCFNDTSILVKDNRLPATIEMLIALIRKIEDNTPYPSNRELSAQILQSFRQDGIVRSNRGDLPSSYGIPYSPKEWNAYKNKVLLRKVIPYESELDIDILTDLEQCSLHFFLSKSVEYKTRGDEDSVCSQLGKYRMRHSRQTHAKEEVEQFDVNTQGVSACPVELGVVNTKWGAVSTGNLLAGIASGLNFQMIPVNGTSRALDSRFAASLVGDLAEVALYQLSRTNGRSVEVGAEGNWNSTLEPKWYFLRKNSLLQLTDAEIRGGLDGLYLGLSMEEIRKKYQDIKISQILDLYYSPRGVFNSSLKACNRKISETSFTSTKKLIEQTAYFEALLDPVATIDSTIDPHKYRELAELSVNEFNNYLPEGLRDPPCNKENTTIFRIASDLVIFLDMKFKYQMIQPLLSYLLEKIDVNKFESKYSIVNALNAETLINSSTTILDYHQLFNETVVSTSQQGIDFGLILETIESLTEAKMNNKTNYGGTSYVHLIVSSSIPSQSQINFAVSKIETMRRNYPDLRIIILGVGFNQDYKEYVINPDSDVFIIPNVTYNNLIRDEAAQKTKMNEIVERLKELPREIINPSCGTKFDFKGKSTLSLVQYVEPGGVNTYKISPNYFYNHGDDPTLRIRGQGYGSFRVCTSRIMNGYIFTNSSLACTTINSDEYSQNIKDYCGGEFSECDPIYVYIEGETSYYRCNDQDCRFPDNIKFTISLENVGCANSGHFNTNVLSLFVAILCAYLHFYFII